MMKPEERVTFALELVQGVLRSWWTLVAGVSLGVAVSLIALKYIPETYAASTTVFVARHIPKSLVANTVPDDMKTRMASLKEAVLSRPYLETIIEENYASVPQGEELEKLVMSIRARVKVRVRSGLFSIAYRDSDSERTARVVNALAQLYIDENASFRALRSKETTETLQALAATVLEQLTAQEQAILDFTMKHPFETVEHSDANLRKWELRQRDLQASERNLQYEEQHLEELKSQLPARWGSSVPGPVAMENPRMTELAALETQLNGLLMHYLEDHPSVKAKMREIEEFRRSLDYSEPMVSSGEKVEIVSPTVTKLESQIRESERKNQAMRDEQTHIKQEIARLYARIEATPITQSRLAQLSKGYDALKQRYEDYQAKVEAAKGAQQVEEDRRGEQFEVIERAIPSLFPVSPRPLKVFGVNIVLGLALIVGPIVIKRVLNPVVRSQGGLKALSDVPLLVVVPELLTQEVMRRNRFSRMANWSLSVVSLVLVVAAAIFVYQ